MAFVASRDVDGRVGFTKGHELGWRWNRGWGELPCMIPYLCAIPRVRKFGAFLPLAFSLAVLAACEDATTDPLARLVAEETAGALALGVELPDPGSWTVPDDASPAAADAVVRWSRSWDLFGDEGRAVRSLTYEPLATLFVQELGRGGIGEQLDRLYEGVRRALELPEIQLPEHILTRLSEASNAQVLAREALRTENLQVAMVQLLKGADALREVGPEAVARTMVSEVNEERRSISVDDPYSEQDLQRLDRLLQGGREALTERDWVRAIRRAFYARGLMESGGA